MPSSDALTFLVGSSGPAAALHDALRDWSAEGFLNDFVWVSAEAPITADLVGLLVDHGVAEGVGVQEVLAGRQPPVVRVVSLNTADGSDLDTAESAKKLASLVYTAGGGVRLVKIRVFLVDPRRQSQEPTPIEGWHNVLLSPEDAQSPTSLKMSLPSRMSVAEFGAWAAPSIAAVTGLYAGLATSPFDEATPLPGFQVRAVRAFYRRLDATALVNDLRAQVLSLGENYPKVRDGNQESQYIEDSGLELATSTMAKALWSRHQHVLKGARVTVPEGETEPIGVRRALVMFFSFLWSALRGAPVAWWGSMVGKTKAKLALAVQDLVFGDSDSAYHVVITGMAHGAPLDLTERLAHLRSMEQGLASLPQEQVVHSDLSQVWQDYVGGALTLMDGGQRQPSMPPVQIGTQRGVLRRSSLCIPDHPHAFTEIPGALSSVVRVRAVAPADTFAAHRLWEHLDRLSSDPHFGVEAEQTKQALQKWASQNQRTYVAQCAGPLAAALVELTREIAGLREVLERASSSPAADNATKQHLVRMAKRLRWLLFGFAGLVVLLVVGGIAAILGWVLVSVLCLIALGAWLGSSLAVFLLGQRALFRWLAERRKAVTQADAAQRNLVQAIRDASRVGDAYCLFLQWSRVLGTFLVDPLGEKSPDAHVASGFSSRLPLAVRLGVARTNDTSLAQAARDLRARIFDPGWLDGAWTDCLGAVGAQLGPAAVFASPEEIYCERAVEESHMITDWADALEVDGVRSHAGERVWKHQTAETDFGSLATYVSEPDLSKGRGAVIGDEVSPSLTLTEFMQGAELPVDVPGRPRLFAGTAFSEDARVEARHAVGQVWNRAVNDEHGRGAVLVEMSAGVRPSELGGSGGKPG